MDFEFKIECLLELQPISSQPIECKNDFLHLNIIQESKEVEIQ
ncbi:MAG: hypothetical protein ACP5U0_07490 [Caldisphaera sp.]